MAAGLASRRNLTAPVMASIATSWCFGPVISASAYTVLVAGSAAGVLVMPSGAMFPHGNVDSGTGGPTLVRHSTAPVWGSRPYSELFSVATTIRPPTKIGWAYTSPSSTGDVHALLDGSSPVSALAPRRVLSPWYVGHDPVAAVAGPDRTTAAAVRS